MIERGGSTFVVDEMAPNPNECVALMQQQDAVMVVGGQVVTLGVSVKVPIQVTVMRAASGDDCSEDGEHFYDASSEVQSDDNDANGSGGSGGGDGGNKDSGVDTDKDNSCGSYDVPDPVLAAQIVEQVEYYFSDAHILKDAFLLKHARRNRDGYISLKLITSFKKVDSNFSEIFFPAQFHYPANRFRIGFYERSRSMPLRFRLVSVSKPFI